MTLDHESSGQHFRAELPFRRSGLLKHDWERVQIGDVVPIRVNPVHPEVFYAPSFL